jgi:hypothetical protein
MTMQTTARIITAALALALAGCASINLSNRASRTVACDKVLVTSMYQWFGITVELDKRDAAELLKACKS